MGHSVCRVSAKGSKSQSMVNLTFARLFNHRELQHRTLLDTNPRHRTPLQGLFAFPGFPWTTRNEQPMFVDFPFILASFAATFDPGLLRFRFHVESSQFFSPESGGLSHCDGWSFKDKWVGPQLHPMNQGHLIDGLVQGTFFRSSWYSLQMFAHWIHLLSLSNTSTKQMCTGKP